MKGVTLDQILMLTGRLDESAGFDSARERYRRFLLDHVREPAMARVLIDECQHAPGDEYRRALQDLVVLLGRFLGFHARFGFAARYGEWQSKGVHVLVDVRAGQAPESGEPDAAVFSRAVAAAAGAASAEGVKAIGLSVVTPMDAAGAPLEPAPPTADGPVAVVSLSALLSVTALAAAGRASHDDVVRLLTSSAPLGFVLALLERCADDRALLSSESQRGVHVYSTGFWILRLAGSRGTTPEEFLEIVIGRRHLLGLAGDRAVNDAVQPGDRICFSIEGKGVVGHGRVVPRDADQPTLRDAHRFRHVWGLDDIRVYLAAPVAVDVETELRLRAAGDPGREGQTMVSISRESFDAMTSPPREPSAAAPETPASGAPRLAG